MADSLRLRLLLFHLFRCCRFLRFLRQFRFLQILLHLGWQGFRMMMLIRHFLHFPRLLLLLLHPGMNLRLADRKLRGKPLVGPGLRPQDNQLEQDDDILWLKNHGITIFANCEYRKPGSSCAIAEAETQPP